MRIKTIIILVITIVLTIIFMQNLEAVKFTILFSTVYISKVAMMLIVLVTGFILGFLAGRPRRSKYSHVGYEENLTNEAGTVTKQNTLSPDDREYLN